MNEELISIIIPVYKVELYIHKCVESVIAQTYKNIEILLVDDGSPDACPQICDEYAKKDNRIKVIHKDNGGLSDARNAGLDNANGCYIMFVDSDDYIDLNMVEILYRTLKNNNADMSMCNFRYLCDNPDNKFRNENLPIKDEVISGETVLKEKIFQDKSWYWVVSVCKLYKANIYNNLRFELGKLHEDEFILHKVMLQCDVIACVSKPMYVYYQRANSIMSTMKNINKLDSAEALFVRSAELGKLKGYMQASVKNLLMGASNFHSYYLQIGYSLDKPHVERNKQLQKMYRKIYLNNRRNFKNISIKDKMKLIVNFISLYAFVKLYYKLTKIIS